MAIVERKTRQKEGIRQDILDAARELFAREGYDSVSMRNIADKVEYATGTLYLYFRDKADIFDCLCEETFLKLEKRLQAIRDDTSDPLDRLRRGLRIYVEFGIQNPNHYIVTFLLRPKEACEGGELTRKQAAGLRCFDHLRQMVGRCIDEDKVVARDAEETSQVLLAAVHGLTAMFVTRCGPPLIEPGRLTDRMTDVLMEGIRKH